jgi:hypothetical protein
MRKTIVMALVALLAMLAVVSCDSILAGQKPEYTEDGQRLVTLKVNAGGTAGNSRSLTDAIAKLKADYMEVIFHDSGKYYHADDYMGTLSIKIPAKLYADTDAILFIGRKSDGTLLAVGTLDTGSLNVTAGTSTLTFNVTSLTTELNADAGTPSFVIDPTTTGGFPTTSLTKFDNSPCFQVFSTKTGLKASLAIDGFGATNDGNIIEVTGTAVTFNNIGGAPAISVTTGDIDAVTFVGGVATVGFTFDAPSLTPPADGPAEAKYNISFVIPVKGFVASSPHLTWYIRSGIKAGTDLDGGEKNGVALLVTDSAGEWSEGNVVIGTW